MENQALNAAWGGRTRLACAGRLVLGPDRRTLAAAVCFIVVPYAVFLSRQGPDLGARLSWAPQAVVAALGAATVLVLLRTATSDPGIKMRVPHGMAPSEMPVATVNGRDVQLVWCRTCLRVRGPRTHHCAVCDNCVTRFDHHCPWVGTCIGARNYRTFFLLIHLAALSAGGVAALCGLQVYLVHDDEGYSVGGVLKRWPDSVIIGSWCALLTAALGFLCGFHVYLVFKNITTYEFYKGTGKEDLFGQGCVKNIADACCVLPPTELKREALQELAQGGIPRGLLEENLKYAGGLDTATKAAEGASMYQGTGLPSPHSPQLGNRVAPLPQYVDDPYAP
ncbi:unnamed protein product [Pedinophyceae sp. YPF-701]|nr:unnamed protein product [Pedinophyceae sp. YPF-701]